MLQRSAPFCFALFLALQFIGVSEASATEDLARLHASSALLEWMPQVAAEEFTLRLAGPDGAVRSWRFPSGSVPSLSLFDTLGQPLPGGLYTYELRATPRLSEGLRERLREARTTGDEGTVQRLQREIPGLLVQSGTFQILGGAVLTGQAKEVELGPRLKDQMVPDDLIVDGKGCVGLGCTNGEGFGAEALRLKQSVVRLRFEDTSSSAGFPSRDWQLTVNDPGSGGSDRFSIEDLTAGRTPLTIRGNAPDNALVLDSSGKLGLRTATPAQDIHVASGNTPAVRLEQTTAGGFPARTWDVGANDTGFSVKDVTGSKTPLLISAGAPTSSIEVSSSGNVGIGAAAPAKRLTIKSGGGNNDVLQIVKSSGTTPLYRFFETVSGDGLFSVFDNTGTEAVRFTSVSGGKLSIGCVLPEHRLDIGVTPGMNCSGSVPRSFMDAGDQVFTVTSSRTLKENLRPVLAADILDKILSVKVYNYDFIDGFKDKIGLMAEDFHTIFGRGSDKVINGQEVEMALWLAVQELTAENKELKNQLAELKAEQLEKQQELIHQIEERLARLEGKQ